MNSGGGEMDSREQGDKLGSLRQDGDIFRLGLFRDCRFGLLGVRTIVRAYGLRWGCSGFGALVCLIC